MEEEIGEAIRTCRLIDSKTKIHEVLEIYISRIYNKVHFEVPSFLQLLNIKHGKYTLRYPASYNFCKLYLQYRKYIFEVSNSMEELFKAARIMKPTYQKSIQLFDIGEHLKLIKKIHQNMRKISLEIDYNSDKVFSRLLDKELIYSRESQVMDSESGNFTDANTNKQFPNSPQNKEFSSLLDSDKKLISSRESQGKNSESGKFTVANDINEQFPSNSPQNNVAKAKTKEFSSLVDSDKKLISSRESQGKNSESGNFTVANINEQFPSNSPQNNVVKAKTKEFSPLLDSDKKLISSRESQGKNSESGNFTVANINEQFPSNSPQNNVVKAKTKEFSSLLDSDKKLISSRESQGKNSESGKFTVANINEQFPSNSPQNNVVKAKTKEFSSLLDSDKKLISSRESQGKNSESGKFTVANINEQFPSNSPQNNVVKAKTKEFSTTLSDSDNKLISSKESQGKNSESGKFTSNSSQNNGVKAKTKEFSTTLSDSDNKLISSKETQGKNSESGKFTSNSSQNNGVKAKTKEFSTTLSDSDNKLVSSKETQGKNSESGKFTSNSSQNNGVKAKTKEFSTTLSDSDKKLISSKESQGKSSESGKITVANTNEQFRSTSPQNNSVKAKTNSIKKLPTQNPEKSDIDSKESSQKNLSCRRKDKIITKEKESIKLNDFEDFTCNDKDSDSDLEPYAEMEEINYDHFRHGHKGEDNTVANKKNIKTTSQDFASKRKQENAGTNEREEEFVFIENHFGESSLLPSYSGFSSNSDTFKEKEIL
ncbi:hypothetical protein Avbf_10434 [Armadillidium vulgare]|nr:hypothetical protein Avbf_10434 [Armadillidium vulgare]